MGKAIKDSRPCKVYEFKADLSDDQQAWFDHATQVLAIQWNEAHALMLDHQQRLWREKRAESVPATLQLKWRNKSAIKTVGSGTYTSRDGGKCCPIYLPKPFADPLKQATDCRSHKNFSHEALSIPGLSGYRDSVVQTLKESWKRYRDPKLAARRPKFKGGDNRIKSLIVGNARTSTGFSVKPAKPGSLNARVKMPGLGEFKVKAFYKRFPEGLDHGKVTLIKDGGNFYIQFMARVTPAQVLRDEPRRLGIDPGVKAVVATSAGQLIKPKKNGSYFSRETGEKVNNHKRYTAPKKRLKRLSRKLARQQKGSAGWQRTKEQVNRCHAKVKRSRKAYNAKVADWLGRFDIAFEGSRLQNMSRRAKPKQRENGKGYERNGAKAKSGLNRSLLENGLGQIRTLTEARCKSREKVFIKTADKDVRYSSRRCHCCDERGKRVSQEVFVCLNGGCSWHGLKQHADVNAAKNHLKAGFGLSHESYPGATGKVMRVESGATLAGQPGTQPTGATLEASGTTLEATTAKAVQALGSAKDHRSSKQSKASQPNTSDVFAAQEVLDPLPTRVLRSSKAKKQKRTRSPSEVLAKPPSSPRQLELWEDAAWVNQAFDREAIGT